MKISFYWMNYCVVYLIKKECLNILFITKYIFSKVYIGKM